MGGASEHGAIGRRIKAKREAAGMSQRRLGDLAGVSSNAVHQVETGRTGRPQDETLGLYAKALGVSVHWLLTGSEPAPDGVGEWPALDIYLAETRGLTLDQSRAVERIVQGQKPVVTAVVTMCAFITITLRLTVPPTIPRLRVRGEWVLLTYSCLRSAPPEP